MLTEKEKKELTGLLGKIEDPHKGLPQEVFEALVKIVPFVACEIIIMNEKKEFFMTWRADNWHTGWHFPGGLMRFRERFEDRLRKTAQRELGVDIIKYRFLLPINYLDSRHAHGVSLVFECISDKIPMEGKFFKRMPIDIIPDHEETWKIIEDILRGSDLHNIALNEWVISK